MTRTNLYNLIACLFGGFLKAGFEKASEFCEGIKSLGCFYGKLLQILELSVLQKTFPVNVLQQCEQCALGLNVVKVNHSYY